MTVAIVGLIGVVVGRAITAGLQLLERWLSRRDRRRVALRLLIDELRANLRTLPPAVKYGWWWRKPLQLKVMEEYRPELAGQLTDDESSSLGLAESTVSFAESRRETAERERETLGQGSRALSRKMSDRPPTRQGQRHRGGVTRE